MNFTRANLIIILLRPAHRATAAPPSTRPLRPGRVVVPGRRFRFYFSRPASYPNAFLRHNAVYAVRYITYIYIYHYYYVLMFYWNAVNNNILLDPYAAVPIMKQWYVRDDIVTRWSSINESDMFLEIYPRDINKVRFFFFCYIFFFVVSYLFFLLLLRLFFFVVTFLNFRYFIPRVTSPGKDVFSKILILSLHFLCAQKVQKYYVLFMLLGY